jgi:alcohol dehydrogenase class IV
MNLNNFGPFSIARLPRIEFGRGMIASLGQRLAGYGACVLVITGARALQNSAQWPRLQADFARHKLQWRHCTVSGEPSPQWVDQTVAEFADQPIDVVVGIGGGSVLDAAKAVAGLLRVKRSVMDYLEGVGPELTYHGPAVTFIAVPTTAGTGSEATKNAVLSVHGPQGFKKSFRHDLLVAEYAVIDPDLLASCPRELIAANGMDALTQLIESYVSTRANVFTDALAISGMRAVRDGLLPWYEGGASATAAHEKMAYAALISGITLAQTGLGSVHGLAAPLGAFFPIPHGVVCGTLVAVATQVNINSMQAREPQNPALDRYARVSEILCERRHRSRDTAWLALVELLTDWTKRMQLPGLTRYGITRGDFEHIVAHARGSSMKTNPVVLTDAELHAILASRLQELT